MALDLVRRALAFLLALGVVAAPVSAYEQRALQSATDLNTPPTIATAGAILSATDLLTATSYFGFSQPDTPRNLVVAVVDTTPSIVAGTVTITGTDINGAALSEAFSIAAGAGSYAGTKLFKTVTSISNGTVTVLDGLGDETIAVGSGSLIAWNYCSTSATTGTTTCGFSDSDGWVDSSNMTQKLITIEVLALSATGGVSYSIECRGNGLAPPPKQILTAAGYFTAAILPGLPSTASADSFVIPEGCASIRLGLKYGTVDTSGTDSITAYFSGQKEAH